MFTNPQRMGNEESRRLRQEAGRWLSTIRLRQGLTQREVAEAIGFRFYTHYAQIEAGVGRVSADRMHLLAAALGLDPQAMTRRLMRAYDPVTFTWLFDESAVMAEEPEPGMPLMAPLAAPLVVPEYTADDAKGLRQEAGRLIRRRREQLGLSQTDLAEPLGYKFYTRVSQIERGIGRVPPEEFPAYARALRWDLVDFSRAMLAHYDPMIHHLAYLDQSRHSSERLAPST